MSKRSRIELTTSADTRRLLRSGPGIPLHRSRRTRGQVRVKAKPHLLLAQNRPWCTASGPALHGRAFARIADAWGHRHSMRAYPNQGARSYLYNGAGELKSETDARGWVTTFSYLCPRQPQFCIADSFS